MLHTSLFCFTIIVAPRGATNSCVCKVRSMLAWFPCISEVGVSLTFITYGEYLRVCVVADRALILQPQTLCDEFLLQVCITKLVCCGHHFVQQMTSLSKLLMNRRIPGEMAGRRIDMLRQWPEAVAEPSTAEVRIFYPIATTPHTVNIKKYK